MSFKKMFIGTSMAAVIAISSGTLAFSVSAAESAGWHKNKDGYYYTLEDGDKITGWQKIGNSKYYFGNDGIAVTGFKKIKGKTYYFDPEKKGRMATSWKTINGYRYYFGTDGVMRTGWKTISGNTYYFSSSGKAAAGKVKINGKSYTFSSKGVLQKTADTSSDSKSAATTSSSSVYASNALGKASYGMTSAQVVKANKIKNYVTLGESDDYRVICCQESSYLGSKSDGIMVMFLFDKSDKMMAAMAVDIKGKSDSAWKKYAENKFGEVLAEEDGVSLYGDLYANQAIMIGLMDNANIIVEMDANYIDEVNDAMTSILADIS